MGVFQARKRKYMYLKSIIPRTEKWQLDVKYVPVKCYVGDRPDKFYQYTMIDEASREIHLSF